MIAVCRRALVEVGRRTRISGPAPYGRLAAAPVEAELTGSEGCDIHQATGHGNILEEVNEDRQTWLSPLNVIEV